MSQSVKNSWIESVITTAISILGTFLAQWLLFPLIGIEASNDQLWAMSLIFGLLNTVKTFFVRRYFNGIETSRSNAK